MAKNKTLPPRVDQLPKDLVRCVAIFIYGFATYHLIRDLKQPDTFFYLREENRIFGYVFLIDPVFMFIDA